MYYFIYFIRLSQALGVFGLCQIHALVDYLRSKLSQKEFEILFRALLVLVITTSCIVGGILTVTGIVLFFIRYSIYVKCVLFHTLLYILLCTLLNFFKAKYHHGLDAFTLCSIHLMQKIIFQ